MPGLDEEGAAKMKPIAFWIFVAGVVLLLDPRCTRGCRTLAEHLVSHGLERL